MDGEVKDGSSGVKAVGSGFGRAPASANLRPQVSYETVATAHVSNWLKNFVKARCSPKAVHCSTCGTGTLRVEDFVKATCVNEAGERYPDSWTIYECEACGERTKVYRDGRVENPSDVDGATGGPT